MISIQMTGSVLVSSAYVDKATMLYLHHSASGDDFASAPQFGGIGDNTSIQAWFNARIGGVTPIQPKIWRTTSTSSKSPHLTPLERRYSSAHQVDCGTQHDPNTQTTQASRGPTQAYASLRSRIPLQWGTSFITLPTAVAARRGDVTDPHVVDRCRYCACVATA